MVMFIWQLFLAVCFEILTISQEKPVSRLSLMIPNTGASLQLTVRWSAISVIRQFRCR
jgi:hypothetical protein